MPSPKITLTVVAVFFLYVSVCFSQRLDLSTLTIPQELKENANSVVRFENTVIEMKSQRNMTITIEAAITVLNKQADQQSEISLFYDKRQKIKNVSVYVYNAMGIEIKKIKKNDFDDYSVYDGFSLFNDGRFINYDYTPTEYPYTIHYSYEVETSNTAYIQPWFPVGSMYQSVQKSTYSFSYPADVKAIKKEINFDDFEITSNSNQRAIKYTIENYKALEPEPNDPAFRNIVPWARIGVNKFNLEGVDGRASDWKEYGKWYYDELLTGTSDLSETTKNKIRELVRHESDPVEKAKIVYEYVQNKVRYISIQIGVGGYKPMLASEVDELSYGDCKGLTNYTRALLEAVGIDSYCAIIYGGYGLRDIEDEFVSVQGNHMILYLPINGQDYWLECTSQISPFADVSNFTDDRKALVIKPEGGEIKRTTRYLAEENLQNIKGDFVIDEKGNITAHVSIVSQGTQMDNRIEAENSNLKDREKLYKEFWDNINNITLTDIQVNSDKKAAKFEEQVSFTASKYVTISGDRMIIPLNAFNVIQKAPKRVRNRKLPVEVSRGFYNVDEVKITLPEGYMIEAIADDVNIETQYGTYSIEVEELDEQTLNYTRKFLFNSGNYPKESYQEFLDFWRKVVKYDKSKIVLSKI